MNYTERLMKVDSNECLMLMSLCNKFMLTITIHVAQTSQLNKGDPFKKARHLERSEDSSIGNGQACIWHSAVMGCVVHYTICSDYVTVDMYKYNIMPTFFTLDCWIFALWMIHLIFHFQTVLVLAFDIIKL